MERFGPDLESIIADLSGSPLFLLRTLDDAALAAVVDGFVDSRATACALFNNGQPGGEPAVRTTRDRGAAARDTCPPTTA
ncbi:hypothetical protein [Actinomadura sp. 9N407]|uniref:hypothetical protein n=1 Tax=Actinomadura sp. 9N407 TaxID=3375154 RepID=UPI0037913257